MRRFGQCKTVIPRYEPTPGPGTTVDWWRRQTRLRFFRESSFTVRLYRTAPLTGVSTRSISGSGLRSTRKGEVPGT